MNALAGLAFLAVLQAAAGEAEAKAALERLSARFRDVRTLSAKFTQTRVTALLDQPLISSGTFAYRRDPARLVFRITEPRRTEIHLDRTTYQVHRPDEKRLERIEFEDPEIAPRLLMIFDPRPDEVGKAFSFGRVPAGAGEIGIRLEPADENLRRRLKGITLVLAEADATLKRLAYADPEGDETRLDFTDLALNPALPPATFELAVPEGTRVLRHTVKASR